VFRVWQGDEPPPSHSVPPHLVAKAAAALGAEAFERVHEALLRAYFEENRDISSAATLRAIWLAAGLPEPELARAADPELLRRVAEEHNQAVELGVNGVPAVAMADEDVAITGAHPTETYRRWIRKRLEQEER
jgi:predicted DsbA family dithiol-disulfide isomerase